MLFQVVVWIGLDFDDAGSAPFRRIDIRDVTVDCWDESADVLRHRYEILKLLEYSL